MAISLPDASFFQAIADEIANSDEIRNEYGLSKKYTAAELRAIGEQMEHDIEAAYIGSLRYPNVGLQYGAKVSVKTGGSTGKQVITITYPPGELHRESFEKAQYVRAQHVERTKINGKWKNVVVTDPGYYTGTGEHTGEGIDDIFALITTGYSLSKPVSGYWYNAGGFFHAPMHRQGTPFVPSVVAKYEAMYPGVHITYPGEWG